MRTILLALTIAGLCLGCGGPASQPTGGEFIVDGDWAFERYSYKSTDTPSAGGAVVETRDGVW